MHRSRATAVRLCLSILLAAPGCDKGSGKNSGEGPGKADVTLTNSSYDPTREMYADFNAAFAAYWKGKGAQNVTVQMSHGPSGKQSRAIIDGFQADVAALSVDFDIDEIARKGKLLPDDWRAKLPDNSSPYTSAVVFLVRKGNPKQIKDWPDLAKPGLKLLAPNPKTGGGARWIYLAAWGSALGAGADEAAARDFTGKVYRQTGLDPAMRGSTVQFVQQGQGDCLFGWENEILQVLADPANKDKYEIVVPSSSITIEVPIAVVETNARKHGVKDVAEQYVKYLWSDEGQEIVARRFNRPRSEKVMSKYAAQFPKLKQYTLKDKFGGWDEVMKKFFVNGAIFDQQLAEAK